MPYRNAAGQFYDGRAKDAKSEPLNKDQHPPKHHHQADYGPPFKKRRIQSSAESTVSGASAYSKGPLRITFKPKASIQQPNNGFHGNLLVKKEVSTNEKTLNLQYEDTGKMNVQQDHGKEQGDKRILRSQDPGAHGTSELALFFENYWDVINGPDEEPGNNISIIYCRRL